MDIDIFKDILVPVIGGLGIFMLGLDFMANGIQALSVNRMRAFLAKAAGTPIKGVLAGTLITGVIQSSTAMSVMVVGLVNAGVIALRPAISVIMGANIGTTLGNGLIALPLGPLGLILAGVFSLIYCFAKSEKVKNIALAGMGFALIFYGLNLMTGGLRPLRNLPEVMALLQTLTADSYLNLLKCVFIAAGVTAMIHSSSATIGIVMGLGAAGILDWTTAVAFSLGADLGTTITSWMASLNLSKNARRTAYAHISFNIIGVCITIPLFFVSMQVLEWAMQFFGGDPAIPVIVDGKETFPLVRSRSASTRLSSTSSTRCCCFRSSGCSSGSCRVSVTRMPRTRKISRRRGSSTASWPAISPRPFPPSSRRRPAICKPAPCSSTSPVRRRRRRRIRASTISQPISSAAISVPTPPN
ncbi:Na/Pi symporter [Mesorhizobium sp.]|uniref:Na/Pi cotransporter family protein n=1 Tax=Mesorhizobium sp. TaxID=1871066 RepID=UPI00257978D4|nr:Na/Pi symporter [Mesorhizobium sp.]